MVRASDFRSEGREFKSYAVTLSSLVKHSVRY